MNEKIKALADHAGLYTDVSGRWVNAGSMDKFVKLIVEECCSIADNTVDGLPSYNIKEHFFGVEE